MSLTQNVIAAKRQRAEEAQRKDAARIVAAALSPSTYALMGGQDEKEVIVKGRYYNFDYGYSVLVPKGLTAFRTPAPFPNHGFGMRLSEGPESSVWVDASYNAAEWKSFDDAMRDHISYIKDEGGTSVSVVKRQSTRLYNLRAVHLVISYDAPFSGVTMMKDMVLAIRRSKGTEVVYTIELTTPASRYDGDKKVMGGLQKTWTLRRLP